MQTKKAVWALVICGTAWAAAPSGKGTAPSGKPYLLLSRPVEASAMGAVANAWFSALVESYYLLRLQPVEECELVPMDRVRAAVPDIARFGRAVSPNELLNAARSFGATHIVTHTYEVTPKDQSVYYYLELVSVAENQVVMTYENSFPLAELGRNLDEGISRLLAKLQVKLTPPIEKAFKAPIVSSEPRTLQELGAAVFEAQDVEPAKAVQQFVKITAKDPRMGLAYYEAAQRFAAIGDYAQAAQMLDNLMVQCNLAYPSLYAQVARYYRLNNSNERALNSITRAEKEGWSTLSLVLEKAQILEKMGKTAEAQAAYARVLAIDPDQPQALLLMARRDRLDKNYAEAIAKADRLIKQNRNVTEAMREKGLALAAQKQFAQAEATLLSAAKQAPDDPEINMALGEIYAAAKKYDQAAQYYEKALRAMPNNLEILLNVSRNYQAAGNPQEALAVLMKNQQNFYSSKELIREMGLLEYDLKDTANARKHLEATLSLSPPEPRAYLALGNVYAALGDAGRAIPMFEKAEELLQNKLDAQVALARLHMNAKAYDKALPYIQKVLAVKPDYPKINGMRADVLFAQKDYQGALDAYLAERKISGNDSYLQRQVALCYYYLNNLANAELGFKKLMEMDPKSADGPYYLAVLSLKLGKLPDVRTYLSQAEVLGRGDPALYLALAKAYAEKGQLELASEAYLSNLKADPKNEEAWVGLAATYEKMRKDSLAADAYYRAYQLNPDKNSSYLSRAGHIFYGIKQYKLARQSYSEFLKKYSDPTVSLNSARMAHAEKNYSEVIALLSALKEPEASDTNVLAMLAEAYTSTNKTTEALLVCEKLAAKKPRDPTALELAAIASEKAGDLKKAASYYQRYLALPRTSKHQELAFRLGELLVQAQQTALAIEQFTRNTVDYPTDYRNFERLAELLMASGRYADITRLAAPASAKPDAPPRLILMVAQSYAKVNQPQQAATAYERYLSKNQQDSSAWAELGSIYFAQKAYDKAIPPLSQASVLMPKNADVLFKLGMSFYANKRYGEAADPLSRALAAGSKDPQLLAALADCYRSLRDTSRLVEILRQRVSADPNNYDLAAELGNLLVARGEVDKAITALEAASRLKPTDVGVHMLLAGLYGKKNDAKMQGLHINAAFSYAPKDPSVTFAKAQYHLAQNQPAEAKTYLAKTIELDPKHTRALALYGAMLKEERKYREAFEQYNQASKEDPNNLEFLLGMAECAYLTGKNNIAIKVITRALELQPSNPTVLQWAGVFYLKENQDDKAEEFLRQALAFDKNCVQCDEYLGQIYLSRGDFTRAIQHLENAARRDERNDNVLVKLARALAVSGSRDKAVDLCNKAMTINPQNDEALYLLCHLHIERGQIAVAEGLLQRNKGSRTSGWVYLAQGRIEEARGNYAAALSSYRLASRVLPQNADMQMGLGRVYLAQKKYPEAIEAFGVASGLDPGNPQVFIGMGQAYAGQKDYASAKEYFKEAVRVAPNDENAHYAIASTAARQGETMEAITAAKRGIAQSPKSGKLHLLLGELLAMAKQFTEAIEAYEKAARFDGTLAAQAYKGIGDIYFRHLQDQRNAKKYYQKHLDAGGNDSSVKQALSKLSE